MPFGSFRRHMLLTQAVNLARESTKRRAAAGSVGAAAGPEKLVSLECMGGGVKKIVLNNPEKLNALTVDMGEQFTKVIDELNGMSDLRAVVLTGEGRAFSAGGDLDWLMERTKSTPKQNMDIMVQFYNRFLSIRSLPVPTIAAINGPAIGAGMCVALACDVRVASAKAKVVAGDVDGDVWQCPQSIVTFTDTRHFKTTIPMLGFTFATLGIHPGMGAAINGPAIGAGMCVALACDVRVASAKAKLGFTFATLGIHPGMGASHFLPIVAGPETAHRLLFSGGIVGGADAKEMRLVSQVEETGEEALEAALELAHSMANAAPLAVGTCVSTLRAQQNLGLEAALLREASSQAACYASSDFIEGLNAIVEKRARPCAHSKTSGWRLRCYGKRARRPPAMRALVSEGCMDVCGDRQSVVAPSPSPSSLPFHLCANVHQLHLRLYLHLKLRLHFRTRLHADFIEGLNAIVEKRAPVFVGESEGGDDSSTLAA
eukprot:CAMPEP_0182601084 /NCGR_PEP_ID=MMETSP1324-20130603/91305_1 /TAXON_ID=236786 /ORGANISM="Florenciella sp., Strain RCC1587" /LENGTH=486 /DNA_ID=CAMNT_0024818993 /DNA_START=340 /DNA_END=1803 /DNA_ORIENTATION=-